MTLVGAKECVKVKIQLRVGDSLFYGQSDATRGFLQHPQLSIKSEDTFRGLKHGQTAPDFSDQVLSHEISLSTTV